MKKKNFFIDLKDLIVEYQNDISSAESSEQGITIINLIMQDGLSHLEDYVQTNLTNLAINFLYVNNSTVPELIAYLENEINDPHNELVAIRESQVEFDKKYGTETSNVKEQFELLETISMDRYLNSVKYSPSPIDVTYMYLDYLAEMGVDYSKTAYIDVGSGMGRCLLLASDYPFSRVIGVEISSHLHEIAQNNIKIYKGEKQQCTNITSVCEDVLTFEIPTEETVVFYFYEPFSEVIFNQLHEKLARHIEKTQQKIILIFLNRVYLTLEVSEAFELEKRIDTKIRKSGQKEAATLGMDNYTNDNFFQVTIFKSK